MPRFRIISLSLSFVIAGFAPLAAQAQNLLLTNADFSQSQNKYIGPNNPHAENIVGWSATTGGGSANVGTYNGTTTNTPAYTGSIAYFGIATLETRDGSRAAVTPGSTYDLSFLYRNDGSDATVYIDFYTENSATTQLYTPLSSVSRTYAFGPGNPFQALDFTAVAPAGASFAAARFVTTGTDTDVTKVALTDVTPAPEPSAWAGLLTGTLLLSGLALRARRRAAQV